MVSRNFRWTLVALAVLFVSALPSFAATYVVPSDDELIGRVDAIVVGRVLATTSRQLDGRHIETVVMLAPERVLKGAVAGDQIDIIQPGGHIGDRWELLVGGAHYVPGERVIAFLGRNDRGEWSTWSLGLGKFTIVTDSKGRDIASREEGGQEIVGWNADGTEHQEPARLASRFVDYISDLDRGIKRNADYFVDPAPAAPMIQAERAIKTNSTYPPASQYLIDFNNPAYCATGSTTCARWNGARFTINQELEQPGIGTNTGPYFATAVSIWNGEANSTINITAGPNGGASAGRDCFNDFVNDGTSEAFFNYSGECGPLPGDSSIGYAWLYGGSQHTFNGETFVSIIEADIFINKSVTADSQFKALVLHEIGHTLGLRHSNAPVPAGYPRTTNAVMNSSIGGFGSLQPWDMDAVDTVYGNGPICNTPSITSQPQSQTVTSGTTVSLSVGVNGHSPFTFQWYDGASGDTSSPISGATTNTLRYVASSTRTVWARATDYCGNVANSNSATVTVSGGGCNSPTITADPQSQTIASGGSVSLSVTATGTTPFTYQWYQGIDNADKTHPVGTNSATFNSGPLTASTGFWVEVTNACGVDDSRVALITVSGGGCVGPTVTEQPVSQVSSGASVHLEVQVTGTAPFTFQWYLGARGDQSNPIAGATSNSIETGPVTATKTYWVQINNACGTTNSNAATVQFAQGCVPPSEPELGVAPGHVDIGDAFTVSWTASVGADHYRLVEASNDTMTNVLNVYDNLHVTEMQFPSGRAAAGDYYFQVVAVGCNSTETRSNIEDVDVATPEQFDDDKTVDADHPHDVQFRICVACSQSKGATIAADTPFTATVDQAWASVTPSSGIIPSGGTILTVNASANNLPVGTSTATVTVTNSSTNAPIQTKSVSVSLVTPVSSGSRTNPPANTLVVPVVGHAPGNFGSQFQTDLRITNSSSQLITYRLTFTPSNADGTVAGKQTTTKIPAGQTTAFNDIVKNWFALGINAGAVGSLEIRPLDAPGKIGPEATASVVTVASSRTFNNTSAGTFGQYVPAVQFPTFVSKPTSQNPKSIISLQQIAQSAAYRTNLGLVEGAGQPATVIVHVYNDAGIKVKDLPPVNIAPAGHVQLNEILKTNGVALDDGRFEVEVTSSTGKVSAYASVLDNHTNDPLLVSPVVKSAITPATKYVLPGVADLNNGIANWRTDMRVYNAGSSNATATLTFVPFSGPFVSKSLTIAPGEVKALDSVLATFFGVTTNGGAVHVTTSSASSLVVTGRTYDAQPDGTFGQFIQAVTPAQAVGLGGGSLHVLQIEESPGFRTNLGLAEVNGQPATVEISAYVPGSAVAPKMQVNLGANQFTQLNQVLKQLQIGTAYNTRVTVRVIGGNGKVTAYGSVIDNKTQDPTYVPAQ